MTGSPDAWLASFFDPASVAVVGASRDPGKVGGSVLANLKAAGFAGRVIPINARGGIVQGFPAATSIKDVDGPIDLAVVAVPAPAVMTVLQECADKGVGGAVVITAGFRETGREGEAREAELRRWLPGRRLRVLGPNCLGWIRPGLRLNLTFAPGMPRAGGVAFISHSGALAVAILDWSRERHMGFSLFASLGNQADLTETDVVRSVIDDPQTRVIVAYLEGVADGRRFYEVLRAACAVKPVVVLKAGRSLEGARAVSSHTGALAGSDQAFDAAVRQAGAVRARTIEELFDLAHALESQPPPRGRRLVVVTNGGGLGIVATDAAREAGLDVAPMPEGVRRGLREVLPATASVSNPVDLVGDADAQRFADALQVIGAAGSVDAALVLLTAQAATDSVTVARAIIGATRGWTIPVTASFVGGPRVAPGAVSLEEAGLPCYPFPERAVGALAGMMTLSERRQRWSESARQAPPARAATIVAALQDRGVPQLGIVDLAPLLAAYAIDVTPVRLATTPEDAARAALDLGGPVAVKLVSPDITHKTDIGGVRLGLTGAEAVAAATSEMLSRVRGERPRARIDGVMVQPMVPGGHELLLGAVRDEQFGPLVLVGFGGIYVEVLKDTAARLAPVTPAEARAMLDELRMAPVLRGARGQGAVDLDALAATVAGFSRLVADWPSLLEIEVNPLMARPDRVIAVDARATLTAAAPPPPTGRSPSTRG
jgi:acetyltransferase